jgi:hypothetical protein
MRLMCSSSTSAGLDPILHVLMPYHTFRFGYFIEEVTQVSNLIY